ncbi:DUF3267 domain-containing protein [Parabacteroides sp. OttesenSCG-928-G21]|nr:DUF3267 domain-containing protein [Parabacteroides sp. OttesenSCG-928-G21]
MKEKTIETSTVNIIGLIIAPIVLLITLAPYLFMYKEGMEELNFLWIFAALLIAIAVHELIHGFFFSLYAKEGWKSVRFGIIWKALTPYCNCKETITARQYRIALLMPTILLGVLPVLLGYLIPNFNWVFFGCFMIAAGAGDLIIFYLIRDLKKTAQVLDHPEKVGCLYHEPEENN